MNNPLIECRQQTNSSAKLFNYNFNENASSKGADINFVKQIILSKLIHVFVATIFWSLIKIYFTHTINEKKKKKENQNRLLINL